MATQRTRVKKRFRALKYCIGLGGCEWLILRFADDHHAFHEDAKPGDLTGQSVALYTVAREPGHRSPNMIEDRYGHLHDRTELGGKEVVEFRVEEHAERLNGRLEAFRV